MQQDCRVSVSHFYLTINRRGPSDHKQGVGELVRVRRVLLVWTLTLFASLAHGHFHPKWWGFLFFTVIIELLCVFINESISSLKALDVGNSLRHSSSIHYPLFTPDVVGCWSPAQHVPRWEEGWGGGGVGSMVEGSPVYHKVNTQPVKADKHIHSYKHLETIHSFCSIPPHLPVLGLWDGLEHPALNTFDLLLEFK